MKPKSIIRFAAACLLVSHAYASTFTWDGASDSYATVNWNSGQAWVTGNDAVIDSGQVNVGDAGFLAASVTMTGGILELGHANAVQGSALVLNANDVLSFLTGIGTFNAGSLSGSGNIALTDIASAAVTLSVGTNGSSTNYSGALSGAGSLTKSGAGTLTLSQIPGTTGNLTVAAGQLTINGGEWTMNNDLHISNGTLEINPTAKLQVGTSITFDSPGGGVLKLGSGSNFYPDPWASQTFPISSTGGAQNQITGGLNGGINPNGNTLGFDVVRGTDPVSDLKMISNFWNGGSLTKTGNGILELTAGNGLNGTTIISGGTLLISGAATLGSGAVTNHAALVFNLASNLTANNAISGSGTLTQAGSGTIIRLTGSNSYGATMITSGTLQIGNNTTTGTLGNGAVTNHSALVFKRSNDLTVGNTITGSGSMTQSGAGIVTLNQGPGTTGNLTVSAGKLTINAGAGWTINNNLHISNGTLEINGWGGMAVQAGKTITFDAPGGGVLNLASGNFYPANWGSQQLISSTGGAQNRIAGNINANGNTLDFNITRGTDPASDLKVTGGIYNGGAVKKTGEGILEMSASSSYSGTTTVAAGTLHLTGSIPASSAVTVGGATATGTPTLTGAGGTVNGTLLIAAAGGGAEGTVNPGTAGTTGTLHVSGTTISGSYACDVISNTTDLLAVTGNLTITGAKIALSTVTPTPGTYTIATYTGTLTGTFTPSPALPVGTSLDYATTGAIKLVIAAASGYASWASTNSVAEGENGDDDDDGISNLVEYALGLDPQAGDPAPGTFTGNTLTFTKGTEAKAALDVTYKIQTSTTLAADSWSAAAATETTDDISFLLPPNQPGGKLFGRLQVTKP